MEIQERINSLMEYYGLNKNSLSKKVGLTSNTTIENILGKRKTKPSYDILNKILTTFPEINANWLIRGTGNMLNEVSSMLQNENEVLILDISDKLDYFFEEKNLTSYKIAQITGISDVSIGRYRSGKSKPTDSKLSILFRHFPGLEEFLTGQSPMFSKKDGEPPVKKLDLNESEIDHDPKKAMFEEVMDEFSIDEIVTYIHKYEDKRGFYDNEMYRMFIEIRVQRELLKRYEEEERRSDKNKIEKN